MNGIIDIEHNLHNAKIPSNLGYNVFLNDVKL
jgi:hypothetical protein